jgi:O-acetyl-ADP-ribose deacetylase (regulator of RNase III)
VPTTFTKGDLFATEGLSAFAHGCNCAGGMGAGIAVAFKSRWPRMFEEYRARCDDRRFNLGDVFVWNDGDVTIYNLATQEHWKKKAKYPALEASLTRMIGLATVGGVARIGLPRIGAGLGGLDWTRVKRMLAEAGEKTAIELVVFEQFVRARAPEA